MPSSSSFCGPVLQTAISLLFICRQGTEWEEDFFFLGRGQLGLLSPSPLLFPASLIKASFQRGRRKKFPSLERAPS